LGVAAVSSTAGSRGITTLGSIATPAISGVVAGAASLVSRHFMGGGREERRKEKVREKRK
jgi:hypothetical protein